MALIDYLKNNYLYIKNRNLILSNIIRVAFK